MNRQLRTDLAPIARQICADRNLDFGGLIGQGTFKQVFKVRSPVGELFALKVFNRPSGYIRTEREVDALRRCHHPNIVPFIEINAITHQSVKYDYMLEELLGGGTLLQRLEAHGRLDYGTAKELGRPLISVLSHLHDLGLVHRDIKPDNVMYRRNDTSPILVDFGVVRDLSAVSATHTYAPVGPGTPLFSSPEQLTNAKGQTNWRSDQFSLGVMLYYCCFEKHPYEHPSDQPGDDSWLERTALHMDRADEFYANANAIGLPCLVKMTEPWQANRFRTPAQLAAAWEAQ